MHRADLNDLRVSQGGAGMMEHTNMTSFLRSIRAPSLSSGGSSVHIQGLLHAGPGLNH